MSRPLKEMDGMAASLIIEFESGTFTGWVHLHNGYYAGDFPGPRRDDQGNDQRGCLTHTRPSPDRPETVAQTKAERARQVLEGVAVDAKNRAERAPGEQRRASWTPRS